MKIKIIGLFAAVLFSISAAGFAEECPSVKPNYCKGPVLCPSFPVYGKERDCCNMYGGHIDIGFLWEQPWIDYMYSGQAYLDADGSTREVLEECFPYSFGVNASLGLSTDHDNWYVGVEFDWLSSSITNRSITNTFGMVLLPYGGLNFSTLLAAAGNPIIFNADINIYALDVILSRGSYHSKCFSYEPFAGVKGLWYDGSQSSSAGASSEDASDYVSDKHGKNYSAWGVGPMFGFNGEYYFTHTFSLFSDSDVAVLYGKGKNHSYQQAVGEGAVADIDVSTVHNSKQEYFVPVRSILGIKLAAFCMEDQHYVAIKVGYDARYVFSNSAAQDIATSGLYVNLIWDF